MKPVSEVMVHLQISYPVLSESKQIYPTVSWWFQGEWKLIISLKFA